MWCDGVVWMYMRWDKVVGCVHLNFAGICFNGALTLINIQIFRMVIKKTLGSTCLCS